MQLSFGKKDAGTFLNKSFLLRHITKDIFTYILLMPALLLTFIFAYCVMPMNITAFQDYDIFKGVMGSKFVGLKHFIAIFEMPMFYVAILNTIKLSILTIAVTFPAPILFALLINELKDGVLKRVFQSISYLPHFLSSITVIGLAYTMLAKFGSINDLRVMILGEETERINFLMKPAMFIPILLIISVWKTVGWGSILYLAAIAAIDPGLYESSQIDGANRFQQAIHITLPGILPTSIILLIFSMGSLLNGNFDFVYGLQNPYIDFETIPTIVYKQGILAGDYSMSTAYGLFQGVVSFGLTYIVNKIAKKFSGISIW